MRISLDENQLASLESTLNKIILLFNEFSENIKKLTLSIENFTEEIKKKG